MINYLNKDNYLKRVTYTLIDPYSGTVLEVLSNRVFSIKQIKDNAHLKILNEFDNTSIGCIDISFSDKIFN